MKRLIIAEKPNVSRQLKTALEPTAKFFPCNGYGYFEGTNYIICCSLGHLLTFQMPNEINKKYGKWNLADLPLQIPIPIPLKFGPSPAKQYFQTLQKLITTKQFEELIIATDPDREGQGIYERIRSFIPNFPQVLETRMWIKEWTNEGILNALQARTPNKNYAGLKDAAECRAIADYLEGMNGSRAMTCKFGGFKNTISVGSVQTPTAYMLYSRELAIQNFKPEEYYAISLQIHSEETDKFLTLPLKTKQHFTETEAKTLRQTFQKHSTVHLSVKTKNTSTRCLKLPNATDIQKEMNQLYGLSADKTSDILQTLYQEKHLTTYPGTKANEISESSAKMAFQPLQNLLNTGLPFPAIQKIQQNSWTIASHCVTKEELAHEAITPVFGSVSASSIQSLNNDEKRVYEAILNRYIQAFYPSAKFQETMISTVLEGHTFQTKGSILLDAGYQEITGIRRNSLLPNVKDGKSYDIKDITLQEKVTTPPARYTTATLLDAMEHASRFVEDEKYAQILASDAVNGLGTDRTRSGILKEMRERGYYTEKGKSLHPTEKTMQLFPLLPKDSLFSSPLMKAKMEEKLTLIENGQLSKNQYIQEVLQDVISFVDAIKQAKAESLLLISNSQYTCP